MAITTASFAANVSVPELLIVCGVVPLNVKVDAEAGENVKVCPDATDILPLIFTAGVHVIFTFKVPWVMVRLSIVVPAVSIGD